MFQLQNCKLYTYICKKKIYCGKCKDCFPFFFLLVFPLKNTLKRDRNTDVLFTVVVYVLY